jgi:hypothetical protein
MAKFERRFQGSDNAGLRAKIRDAAKIDGSPDDVERAVLSLGRTVALTAAGQRTLAEVAEDYRQARMAPTSAVQGVKVGAGWDK